MAQGALLIFDAAVDYIRDKDVNLQGTGWKVALCKNAVASMLVSEASARLGSANVTEVSAQGNYTAGGVALTLNNEVSGGTVIFQIDTSVHTDGKVSWPASAGSPSNCRTAVVYDSSATTPGNAAAAYIDLTENGTTPVNLASVDIEIQFGTGGVTGEIFKLRTNN